MSTTTKTAQTPNNSATKVITGLVRFSFVHVFAPTSMEGSDRKKYSVSILIPKTDKAQLDRLREAINIAKENGKGKWGGKIPAGLKIPIRDGDVERPDNPEYAGMYFMSASTDLKPGVIGADKQPIFDEDEFYSGCYGRASINFYPYNAAGNKGVACGLNNLMKVKDGERLGGGISAEQDFAEVDNSDLSIGKEDDNDDDLLGNGKPMTPAKAAFKSSLKSSLKSSAVSSSENAAGDDLPF